MAVGALLVRALAHRMHGIGAAHFPTWLTVAALLTGAALLATWLPARRATRFDPARLLNSE